jgi:hypothetical protein
MRRVNFPLLIGAALVLGGILMLLDQTGVLKGASDWFWAGILAIAAVWFLFWFFTDRTKWWAAIPGFTLIGMSASGLLLNRLGWGGLAFLGGAGVGFWAIYFSEHRRWWAILPGGFLVTLGAISAMTEAYNIGNTGGVLFMGFGITFLLVAILANMRWAYIPSAALLVLAFFVGTPFTGALQYAWIGLLLAAGVLMIGASFIPRK